MTALGVVALAASVGAWATIDRTDARLYQGGLLAYALVSAALVGAAALSPSLQGVLGWEPLRRLGLISYGVYLFHWPLYLALDSQTTHLPDGGLALGALRIGVTLALATLSFALIERPIRQGTWPRGLRLPTPALAGGALAVVAVAAVVVPRVSTPYVDPFTAAQERDAAALAALPESAPRVMFFGDSTALMIGAGVGRWGLDTQRLGVSAMVAKLGCGIARVEDRQQFGDVTSTPGDECDWTETWPAGIEQQNDPRPRIAVVLTGAWDIIDRKAANGKQWHGPGDPAYDEFLTQELADATDVLLEQGLTVVWLTTPPLDFGRNQEGEWSSEQPDAPERVARLNELIGQVARERAALGQPVATVDLHGFFAELPADEDVRLRPDGIHVTMQTALEVAEWLSPRILDAADRVSR